jgi:competence protein ComEA
MKEWKSYFVFSAADRRAILVLVILILIVTALPFLITPKLPAGLPIVSLQQVSPINSVDSFNGNGVAEQNNPDRQQTQNLFYFNPNTLSYQGWLQLGIKPKVAQVILKYTAKGGKFYYPEDLRKIYVLSATDADRLIPWVQIPEVVPKNGTTRPNKYPSKSIAVIDVNNASLAEWEALPGIGNYLANKVLQQKSKLGCFYTLQQVKTALNLPDSAWQALEPYLTLNANFPKININKASLQQLLAHPQIPPATAKAIIIYRQQNGLFLSLTDLTKTAFITPATYQQIESYLTVQ